MSWAEGLGGLSDALSSGAPGAAAYARGAIIYAGAQAGASGQSVISQLRSLGISIRRSDFYQTWNAIQDRIGSGTTSMSIPLGVASGAPLVGEPPAGWQGQFVHEVTATIRERTSDGGYALRTITRFVNNGDILSPVEASNQVITMLTTPSDRGVAYVAKASDLLATSLTGLWYRQSSRRGL